MERPKLERQALGEHPYRIIISREELRILLRHRTETGEPLQTYVRRLIRESTQPGAREPRGIRSE